MKTGLLFAALSIAATASGAETDYFPLRVGNRWVLQTGASAPEVLSIEVLRSRVIDSATWYLVSGYAPGERWIRKAADGTVYAYDEKTGAQEVLARLTPGAARYRTALSGCPQSAQPGAAARIADRTTRWKLRCRSDTCRKAARTSGSRRRCTRPRSGS